MPADRNRRAIVVSGGGAKGVFEAGVLYALHRVGFVDFDIVAGASAGSLNGGFFAEYVHHWREQMRAPDASPATAQRALEPLIERLLYMWTHVTDWGVIDFGENADLRRLIQAVSDIELSLPMVVGAWWALTTPRTNWLQKLLVERVLGGRMALRALVELVQELGPGDTLALARDLLRRRSAPSAGESLWQTARPYIKRYIARNVGPDTHLWRAVVPVAALRNVLTAETPRLAAGLSTHPGPPQPLISPERRLSAYRRAGTDVRFTRTNLRTGYLEISAFVTVDEFIYDLSELATQYGRLRDEGAPLDFVATRVHTPGDPRLVEAAIASSAYPGMVEPIRVNDLYPRPGETDKSESAYANRLLYLLLRRDAANPFAYRALGDRISRYVFEYRMGSMLEVGASVPKAADLTRQLVLAGHLLPLDGDHYVDGGVIDNTPTRSAIDAARDADARGERGFRDLDVFVVFLSKLPREAPITAEEMAAQLLIEVGMRALFLQGQAKQVSDVTMQSIISRVLGRLRRVEGDLEAALEMADSLLAKDAPAEVMETLRMLRDRLEKARTEDLPAQDWIRTSMFTIFPMEMAFSTFTFHERLGFSMDGAGRGIAHGCAATLEKLYIMLRRRVKGMDGKAADAHERDAFARLLALAGQPEDAPRAQLPENWRCAFHECVFWPGHCAHGGR